MRKVRSLLLLGLISISLLLSACVPKVPKEALALRPDSLALKQLQSRKFETQDEKKLLLGAASLLQDLGYQIDESEVPLGVIIASKQADARDTGQIVGAVLIGVFLGSRMPIDTQQKVRVSIVTRPVNSSELALRITFQRIVWDERGQVSRSESLEDPELYREFFEKLSKAVFLEAQQI